MRATFSPLAVAFALARAFCSGGVRAMWVEVCSGCCALAAHVAAAAAGLLAALQTAFSWPTSSKAADRLATVFPHSHVFPAAWVFVSSGCCCCTCCSCCSGWISLSLWPSRPSLPPGPPGHLRRNTGHRVLRPLLLFPTARYCTKSDAMATGFFVIRSSPQALCGDFSSTGTRSQPCLHTKVRREKRIAAACVRFPLFLSR
jgi:hypothetical protein